jgi:ribosome-associated protein
MIQVTPTIAIGENELQEEFIRASGPGGQNVNKVSTAVRLRFDVLNSPSIPNSVRERLTSLARGRITEEGVLIIDARRFRTQGANRKNAVERLVELIHKAAQEPKNRYKTRPTLGSKVHRLKTKHRRAETKLSRRAMPDGADG